MAASKRWRCRASTSMNTAVALVGHRRSAQHAGHDRGAVVGSVAGDEALVAQRFDQDHLGRSSGPSAVELDVLGPHADEVVAGLEQARRAARSWAACR